jgi:hypothetical protein
MSDLGDASKEQRGAFIRDERVLIAWTDDLDQIVPLCKEFEQKVSNADTSDPQTTNAACSSSRLCGIRGLRPALSVVCRGRRAPSARGSWWTRRSLRSMRKATPRTPRLRSSLGRLQDLSHLPRGRSSALGRGARRRQPPLRRTRRRRVDHSSGPCVCSHPSTTVLLRPSPSVSILPSLSLAGY